MLRVSACVYLALGEIIKGLVMGQAVSRQHLSAETRARSKAVHVWVVADSVVLRLVFLHVIWCFSLLISFHTNFYLNQQCYAMWHRTMCVTKLQLGIVQTMCGSYCHLWPLKVTIRAFSVFFFILLKGPAADPTDAPQPSGLLRNTVMKMIIFCSRRDFVDTLYIPCNDPLPPDRCVYSLFRYT